LTPKKKTNASWKFNHNLNDKNHYQQNENMTSNTNTNTNTNTNPDTVHEHQELEMNQLLSPNSISPQQSTTYSTSPYFDAVAATLSPTNGPTKLAPKRNIIAPKNLTNTPYFRGEKPLPSFINQTNNKTQNLLKKNHDTDDSIPEVWDFYVEKYGFQPKNASQLHKFSRYSPDVDVLKYVQAREQFSRRSKTSKNKR